LKQCHCPLALRQYNLSVSPSLISSIGTRVYTNHHETLDIQAAAGGIADAERSATLA
jgi:hypothetical protein